MQTDGTIQDPHRNLSCTHHALKDTDASYDILYRGQGMLPDDHWTYCRAINETGENDLCKLNLSLLAAKNTANISSILCWQPGEWYCMSDGSASSHDDSVVGYLHPPRQCRSPIAWPLIRIWSFFRVTHGPQRAMLACLAARSVDAPSRSEWPS